MHRGTANRSQREDGASEADGCQINGSSPHTPPVAAARGPLRGSALPVGRTRAVTSAARLRNPSPARPRVAAAPAGSAPLPSTPAGAWPVPAPLRRPGGFRYRTAGSPGGPGRCPSPKGETSATTSAPNPRRRNQRRNERRNERDRWSFSAAPRAQSGPWPAQGRATSGTGGAEEQHPRRYRSSAARGPGSRRAGPRRAAAARFVPAGCRFPLPRAPLPPERLDNSRHRKGDHPTRVHGWGSTRPARPHSFLALTEWSPSCTPRPGGCGRWLRPRCLWFPLLPLPYTLV